MEKIMSVQIALLLIFSGALVGLFISSDVYGDVQRKIVEELCLSCVKLKPNTIVDYRFETANGQPHPDFVLENLSKGPVIIAYRIDFCPGCDELEEDLIKVFDVEFGPYDVFYQTCNFDGNNVTFIHINTNRISEDSPLFKSRMVYDIVGDRGNPMITIITYGYNHGFIDPYHSTLYGLKAKTHAERQDELRNYVYEAIELYNEYKDVTN